MRQRLETLLRWFFAKDSGGVLYAVRTALFALVCIAVVLGSSSWFFDLDASPPEGSLAQVAFLAFIAAPLLENLLILAIVAGLRRLRWSTVTTLVGVAVAGFIVHVGVDLARAISGTIGFCVIGYAFIDWSSVTWTRRYWISVLQHALMNVPATVALALGLH
jgi:membrane protease YdiL (CAAX protease family)